MPATPIKPECMRDVHRLIGQATEVIMGFRFGDETVDIPVTKAAANRALSQMRADTILRVLRGFEYKGVIWVGISPDHDDL